MDKNHQELKHTLHDKHHASTLLTNLQNSPEFFDVEILAEGQRFPGHKCILSSYSTYFRDKISTQGDSSCIKIDDIEANIIRLIVDFIYIGKISISYATVFDVIAAAEKAKIHRISELCTTYLLNVLNLENCFDVFTCGRQRNVDELVRQSSVLMSNHLGAVCSNEFFLNLELQDFTNILKLRSKQCAVEEGAYRALVTWTNHDSATRGEHFVKLFSSLDATKLHKSFLKDEVLAQHLVRESMSCLNLVVDELAQRVETAAKNFGNGSASEKPDSHREPRQSSNVSKLEGRTDRRRRSPSPRRVPPPPPQNGVSPNRHAPHSGVGVGHQQGRPSPPELVKRESPHTTPRIDVVHLPDHTSSVTYTIPMRPKVTYKDK